MSLLLSRPMLTVVRGCRELRITGEEHEWRIMYYVDPIAVVLDVLPKGSQKTPKPVIDNCKRRFGLYLGARRAAERVAKRKASR